MNHSISKVKVYMSDDYKLFRLIDGNRTLNKNKIARIIKEIEGGNDILDESPVLVREARNYLEVVDGQHRVEIAKHFKRPVHYILKKQDMSLHNIAKVNSNTEKWSANDFVNAYVKHGNEHYKKLQAFQKKYKMAVGVCLMLLVNGTEKVHTGGRTLMEEFEQGRFEVKKEKEARMLAEICKSFESFAAWNSRSFVMAIIKILQNGTCDFEILRKKYNRDMRRLQSQPNWKGYCENLQSIYNIDNSKQKLIY